MREIKFRAWFEPEVKMIYMHGEIHISTFLGKYVSTNSKLMQFTGLKDKNGKEIYEGDVVENGNGVYLIIYYDNGKAMFRQRVCSKKNVEEQGYEWQEKIEDRTDLSLEENWKEIIGNKFENPELLEEK